jgi:hypothetical protein
MPESKSWIIVSDEGPSTHPVRHTSFEEAKTESFRLAKLRPDLKFGVFELVGTTLATPKKKTVTKWMRVLKSYNSDTLIPGANFYDSKYEAVAENRSVDDIYHGEPVPVLLEIDVDQSVTFEVPNANPAVEHRFYYGISTWGFSRGETFFPFKDKEGAERGAKNPDSNYSGSPVSSCPLVPERQPGYAYYSF